MTGNFEKIPAGVLLCPSNPFLKFSLAFFLGNKKNSKNFFEKNFKFFNCLKLESKLSSEKISTVALLFKRQNKLRFRPTFLPLQRTPPALFQSVEVTKLRVQVLAPSCTKTTFKVAVCKGD